MSRLRDNLLILVALSCVSVVSRAQGRPESSASRPAAKVATAISDIEASLMCPGVPQRGVLASFHEIDPGGDAAIPALTRLLEHPARRVREEAADELSKFGARALPAVSALLSAFEDPVSESESVDPNEVRLTDAEVRDWMHRDHFVNAIGSIGPPVGVGVLWRLIHDLVNERGWIRHSLLAAIVRIDRQGDSLIIEVIAGQLKDDDSICIAASEALARFGPRAASALPALRAALRGRDRMTQQRITAAIHAIGSASPEAHAAFVDQLVDPSSWVVKGALQALDALDAEQPRSNVEQLINELRESPMSARGVYAAHRLVAAGPSARPALATLIAMLPNGSWSLQLEVTRALGAIGPEAASAVPAFMRILAKRELEYRPPDRQKNSDVSSRASSVDDAESWRREVTQAVIEALGRIGPAAKKAVPLMSRGGMIGVDPEWEKGLPLYTITAIERIEPPARTELKVVVDSELRVPPLRDRRPRRQPFVEQEPDDSIRVTVSHRGSLFGDSIELFLSHDPQGRPVARFDYWHFTDCGPPFEWREKVDGGTVKLRFPDWGRGKPLAGIASVRGADWAFEFNELFTDR